MPASDMGWAKIKRELLDGLRSELDSRGDQDKEREQATLYRDALIDFLATNEWAVERKPDRVVFVLGSRDADELRIVVPTIGLEGTPLTEVLRERGWSIAELGDDDAAHLAYEAFRSED